MMYIPPHSRAMLREGVIDPLNLSVTDAATHFGMSRVSLSHMLNGQAAIRSGLAIRLEILEVSTARAWLARQHNYDLGQAQKRIHQRMAKLDVAIA